MYLLTTRTQDRTNELSYSRTESLRFRFCSVCQRGILYFRRFSSRFRIDRSLPALSRVLHSCILRSPISSRDCYNETSWNTYIYLRKHIWYLSLSLSVSVFVTVSLLVSLSLSNRVSKIIRNEN